MGIRGRLLSWGGGALAVAVGLVPLAPPAPVAAAGDAVAQAAPTPTIDVDPSTDLADFNSVSVRGDHFGPGEGVSVYVCRTGVADDAVGTPDGPPPDDLPEANAAVAEECDWENGEMPAADASGAFETEIAVFANGAGHAGTLDCRQPPGCEVVASGWGGSTARAPLVFGPPDAPRGRYHEPVFTDVEVDREIVYRHTTDYKGNPVDLALDVYRPAGDTATKRPVVIFLYGGFVVFGDKTQSYVVDYATEWARRGYVGVAVNYRLRPDMAINDWIQILEAGVDATEDLFAAVDFLKEHADEYGIDADAIASSGWSAGAGISLGLAYGPGAGDAPATSPIAAALPIAGPNFSVIDPGEPPSLVFRAGADETLPLNNSDAVCPEAAQFGIVCELVNYDGAGHGIVYRMRDILQRSSDFLAAEVLTPQGYFDVSADAGGPYEVDEGAAVALAGSGSGAGVSYAWSPGERVDTPGSAVPSLRGVDDGTETLTLTAVTEHGVAASDTAEVTTRNVAPILSNAAVETDPAGRTVSLDATASDPGTADTHTATVDWGDGVVETVAVVQSAGGATVQASHAYASGGEHEITLTVSDDDGGTATWTGRVLSCTVTGTDRSDVLRGTHGDDIICAGGGNDLVVGLRGDDTILGGPGNDILFGGAGRDVLDGEGGADLVLGGGNSDTCVGEIRLGCEPVRAGRRRVTS